MRIGSEDPQPVEFPGLHPWLALSALWPCALTVHAHPSINAVISVTSVLKCHLGVAEALAKPDTFGNRNSCFPKGCWASLIIKERRQLLPGVRAAPEACWVVRKVVNTYKLLDTRGGGRWGEEVSGGHSGGLAAHSFLRKFTSTLSDVNFSKEAGNPAFYVKPPDFYKLPTNPEFLEHHMSQT